MKREKNTNIFFMFVVIVLYVPRSELRLVETATTRHTMTDAVLINTHTDWSHEAISERHRLWRKVSGCVSISKRIDVAVIFAKPNRSLVAFCSFRFVGRRRQCASIDVSMCAWARDRSIFSIGYGDDATMRTPQRTIVVAAERYWNGKAKRNSHRIRTPIRIQIQI